MQQDSLVAPTLRIDGRTGCILKTSKSDFRIFKDGCAGSLFPD
jgi:hypothetical protein